MTYKEQLLDPRWQKKRLQILDRDKWKCTLCSDEKTTLHIHHEKYDKYAWEVADEFLNTVCAHCHFIKEYYKENYKDIVPIIKVGKKHSVYHYLILYVYRVSPNSGHKLLDIFSLNTAESPVDLRLEVIFSEKDVDTFYDFINSLKSNGQ